ncbi:MAG: GlsB/YeaQ/YmgE family stress response membrane protein [Polyangia bacterium]
MNPSYGIILWIVIGAIAGWLGSIIMGTNARQGALMNIVVGILGASLGGFLTRTLFGDNPGNNGFIASLGVALIGACIVIAIARAVFKR